MIKRRKTRLVKVGGIKPVNIGYGNDIVIQSMTKCFTTDVGACCRQIRRLVKAGCDLVRLAVPTKADTKAFARIVSKVDIPLIADIHFSSARAIEAIEAGAAKIRLNPGNIKDRKDINKIIDAAKMHNTAIRIGVNEASIRDLKNKDVPVGQRTKLMLAEMKKYIRIFEKRHCYNIVLSAKSSDTLRTIEVNRLIAGQFDYPIHIGLTHAGLPEDAQVPSAVAIGTLLSEGIGDTIRVSLAGDPVNEVEIAKKILSSLGFYQTNRPELIVCPTCGRTQIDVVKLARKVSKAIKNINKPLRIAVMGCVVNGPGEAADADIAICAGKGKAMLYKRGRKIATIKEDELLPALLNLIENL